MEPRYRSKLSWITRLAIPAVVIAAFGLGYLLRGGTAEHPPATSRHTLPPVAQQPPPASTAAPQQIWTCSMHPQIRLPNPGKCPICGMDLIPAKDTGDPAHEHAGTAPELTLSPTAEKLAQIELSPVRRRFVEASIRMVGKVDYDETRLADITARVPGRIDRLYVNFTGTVVKEGAPMLSLYSPELLSAQEELIQATRAANRVKQSGLDSLLATGRGTVAAARDKLRLYGLTGEQIDAVSRRGVASEHLTIRAPIGGTVVRKEGFEGMYVKTGSRIYTIADLSRVWVKLDAYESDLIWLREGQKVLLEAEAYPGEPFTGQIAFIDPFLDATTRTVKVRVNVPNPHGRLKPQMFVHGIVRTALSAAGEPADPRNAAHATPPLVIPASAPLLTGKRAVVYVAVPDREGVYQGREIVLGPRAGSFYLVQSGLRQDEMVVTRGNFKIDSDLEIQAKPSMMNPRENGKTVLSQATATPVADERTLQTQMGQVLHAYLEVQAALARNDLQAAATGVAHTGRAVAALDLNRLQGAKQERWREIFTKQQEALQKMQKAADLATLRACFAIFSNALKVVIKEFGIYPPQPVYVIHCPMAFDGQGADWLQASPQVHNPYYGPQMLGCGEVTETIGQPAGHPPGGAQHAG